MHWTTRSLVDTMRQSTRSDEWSASRPRANPTQAVQKNAGNGDAVSNVNSTGAKPTRPNMTERLSRCWKKSTRFKASGMTEEVQVNGSRANATQFQRDQCA